MDPLATLAGLSPAITAVREQVRQILATQTSGRRPPPFLFLGETGTGKGLLARSCHQAGPRASGPFVSINCAAIPESLLEAELFGFDRGAFTGATFSKPGLFESANHGTIFLDEIGLMAEALQAKLLTVIDDRTARRLGSTRAESVDVWIMAATSTDLEEAARLGGFRKDLYHRLAVLPIWLPPLRLRGGDILLLAERFLTQACDDYGVTQKTLTAEARAALLAYEWPGNVRELANVMERATLLSGHGAIAAATLGLGAARRSDDAAPSDTGGLSAHDAIDRAGDSPDYRASLDGFERAQLLEALGKTGWNVSRAAEHLGVPRNTLRYRIARHGLRPEGLRGRRHAPRIASASIVPQSPVANDETAASARMPRRAVSFLRVAFAGAGAGDTGWAATAGLDLIAEKVETFGGRVVQRDARGLDAAFGLEPAEDAPGRAANAALAIRRLVDRARPLPAEARFVAAIETVICALESQGEPRITSGSLHDVDRALAALIDDAATETILVGPGAAPHLARHFALARSATSTGARYSLQLVRRDRVADADHGTVPSLTPRRSPFVGRSHEVGYLLERLRQVRETGRGHIVGLMGEAGMGKSRLLAELTDALVGDGVTVFEGRCASHATVTPYALLLDVLRRAWHLDDAETSSALVASIHQRLAAHDLDDESAPVLLGLFGVHTDSVTAFSPEAIKRRAFDLIRNVIVARGRSGCIVLLLEDLHWADQTSEEFLGMFADTLPGAPILVVATTRPGYRAPWLDRSWASQLALPSLALDDARAIVHVLRPELPRAVADSLVRRAEGNPFFLEELARAMGDGAAMDPEVPGTITDVISARMDRLPKEPRDLLETASVLGREVSLPLLEALMPTEGDALAGPLRQLVAAEFLFEQPGPTFVFKHALTQDVAYQRLAPGDRARLHAGAGRAIERLHAARVDEVLYQLTHHWSQTDDHARAIAYLRRLSDRAIGACAPSEALAALEQALRKGEHLPDGPERDRTVLSVVTEFSWPLILLGRIEEVKTLLLQYQPRVERLDDPALIGSFFASLAFPHDHSGAHRQAEALALRALESATRAGDETTMGKALMVLTLSSLWTGRSINGLERANRALDALTAPGGASQWRGLTLWVKAHHEILMGQFDAGVRSGEALWELGERTENRHSQSYGACIPGWVATRRGHTEVALERFEKALEIATNPITRAVVAAYLGEALEAVGRHREAREQLSGSVDLCRLINFPQLVAWNLARLSAADRGAGELRQALVHADEALTLARTIEFPYAEALARRALGLVADAEGDVDAAADHLSAALAVFGALDARYDAALVRLDLATALARTGAREQAELHLADAARSFDAMAVPVWVDRTAALARQLGVQTPS